jgi:hypothetical protein
MLSELKERRLSLFQFVAASWVVTKERFKTLVTIVLIVNVPLALLSFAVWGRGGVPQDPTKLLSYFLISFLFSAAQSLVGVLPFMAIPFVVERSLLNENVDYVRALKTAISRWWNALVTEALAMLIVVGGLLLFIIPGIIWGVYYSFGIFVVVLRNKRGMAALNYSKSLVKPQWGRVVIISFVLCTLPFIPCYILSSLVTFSRNQAVNSLVWGVIEMIVSIYPMVGITLLFLNLDYLKNAQADAATPDSVT